MDISDSGLHWEGGSWVRCPRSRGRGRGGREEGRCWLVHERKRVRDGGSRSFLDFRVASVPLNPVVVPGRGERWL